MNGIRPRLRRAVRSWNLFLREVNRGDGVVRQRLRESTGRKPAFSFTSTSPTFLSTRELRRMIANVLRTNRVSLATQYVLRPLLLEYARQSLAHDYLTRIEMEFVIKRLARGQAPYDFSFSTPTIEKCVLFANAVKRIGKGDALLLFTGLNSVLERVQQHLRETSPAYREKAPAL